MFNWIHGNKRLVQVVLALIVIPFAFWGVNFYQNAFTGGNVVASVEGQKITEQEFGEALRQQQERLRSLLGRNFDPALLDAPEMRLELLEGMISQRLLTQYAFRHNMTIGDEQLRETISSIPAFQEDGRFSKARYEAMLSAQGYSPLSFEASLRRDLVLQQLTGALADSGIASKAAAREIALLRAQQREVSEHVIPAESLLAQVKVAPEAVRTFYDGNPGRFQLPEQVQVEYVVLNNDALTAAEQVPPEEIKAYYEANAAKFGEPEQRRASHILISFKSGASEAEKAGARAKAERILAQVRKSPGSFAELAKKNSDDSGSAAKGGDLGFFSRGMMVRAFEDAAFRLRPNEISEPVESEFGFHIIRLTAIKPGKMKSLEEARPEIERELKKQHATKRYAEAAEAFSNLVYEQSDSLKPAAEKFKLPIRQADGVTRQSSPVEVLNNPRVLAALFADDAIKNRRNIEAIEVGQNTLVSARVIDHKPAAQRPFDEVKGEIAGQLARQEALALARKRGAERLEELKKGNAAAASFGSAKLVSRDNLQGLGAEASAVFRADASKLPAYVGVDSPNGYTLYRIGRVIDVQPDEARQRSVQAELGRVNGGEELRSLLAGLRANSKVEINKSLLEKKQ
ncbi:MAG: SurA N-terminal domain-containing protein [Burkholderiales bacterium]